MPGSPRVELQPLADLLARAPELPQAGDARPPRPRPRRRDAARPARRAAPGRPRRPAAPRPPAPDPRRCRRRRARAADPAADPRRPAGRGRGPARQPDRRAVRRGAHRLPAAHRLGLLSERQRPRRAADRRPRPHRPDRICDPRRMGRPASPPGGWAIMPPPAEHFGNVGAPLDRRRAAAAGHYWAARADTAGGRPERVQARLRTAARLGETFYGLLAQSALGMRRPPGRSWTTFTDERLARARRHAATSAPRSRSPRSARTSSPPT